MKKFISLLLCCVMCLSIFSASAVQVYAVETVSDLITVTASDFEDETITFTVSFAPNQTKVTGANIDINYDPAVLAVDSCVASDSLNGLVVSGEKANDNSVYAVAYASHNGINTGASGKVFFDITFKVIAETRPMANVGFKCVEFTTDDGVSNDITKFEESVSMGTFEFLTISVPKMINACSSPAGIVAEWESVVGATGYNVYRMAEGTTNWELIAENYNGTSYEDTTIKLGTEYTYCATALNEHGEGQKSANPVVSLNFGAIESITATATDTGAFVEWSALAGAFSYDVYRKKVTETSWTKVGNTTETSYADNSIESYVEYNYKVEAIKGKYRAGLACDVPVVKYLAAPVATVTNTENGIEVYFNAVNGAEKYIVEKLSGTDYVEVYTSTVGDTMFTDKDVVADASYTYRVYVKAADMESAKTLCNAVTRLGTPTVKEPTSTYDGMKVTWTEVKGASKYSVFRKVYGTNDYTFVDYAEGTSYIDKTAKSGVVYTYTAAAVNDTGCGAKNVNGATALYLAAPKLKTRENVVGGVKITWSAVEGATGYKVYRKTGSGGWSIVGLYSANSTSFTDKGVNAKGQKIGMKNNTTYKYTVRATNENRDDYGITYPGGYDKTITSGYNTTGLSIKYVAAPALKKVTNTKNGIKVTWGAVSGAKKYKVYRRLSTASYWTYVGESTTTSYEDKGVKNTSGKTYYYSVAAVNTYTSGRNTTGLKIRRLTCPVLVSARSAKAGITVKWKKVTGCNGYYVYRKTASSSYKRIGTLSGINKLSYLDKSAKKGVKYTYTVRARYGSTLSYYNTGISCKDKY